MKHKMDNSYKLNSKALEVRIESNLGATHSELLGLICASNSGKVHLLGDDDILASGYVAWAGINHESAEQLMKYGVFPKYPYEWDEGSICLITDVVFVPNRARLAKKMLKSFLNDKENIIFIKNKRVKMYQRKGNHYVSAYKEGFKESCREGSIIK